MSLELQACLKKYGPPHIFSYRHGAMIRIICDEYKSTPDRYIRFYASLQEVVTILPGYGTLEIRRSVLDSPSMLKIRGKACFNVKCSGELFMEIFWPEGDIE